MPGELTRAVKVSDRYVLCGALGSGGMATVHLGRLVGPEAFARIVAIKRLHAHFAADPEFRLMLTDEARLAARVRHPNAVQMLDVVSTPEELFLVMEYIDGVPLSRLLRTAASAGKRLPPPVLTAIVANVLSGLHAAHEASDEKGVPLGIIHRDVSPDNVLVGSDGLARVLDFGVAKATNRLQSTRDGQIKGKLAYMAPEQLGGHASQLSDVFAASIVLWEGLVGARLFRAEDDVETIGRVLAGIVESPDTIVPDLSPKLCEIVMRGLARAASDRWPTARDMSAALEEGVAFATPSQVGAFVEASEGAWLTERRALVRRGESLPLADGPSSEPMLRAPADVPVIHEEPGTMSNVLAYTEVAPKPSSSRRSRLIVGQGLVGLVAVGLIAWGVSGRAHPPAATAAPVMASAVDVPSSPPASSGSAATAPPPPAEAAPRPPLPVGGRPTRTVRSSTPTAAAARPSKAASNPCDPPFHLGPLGEKIWVKECL